MKLDFYHTQDENAVFVYVKLWEPREEEKLFSHSKCLPLLLITSSAFLFTTNSISQRECIPGLSNRQIAFICQEVVNLDLRIP